MTPEEKDILNMRHIAPYNSKGVQGWIFRIRYYPGMETGKRIKNTDGKWHSKGFYFSQHESPDAALDAAREYRNQWIEDHKNQIWIRGGGRYGIDLPSNNTSGILGVNRTHRILPSGLTTYGWQTHVDVPNEGRRTLKSSILRLGEIGALKECIQFRRDNLKHVLALLADTDAKSLVKMIDYYEDILANLDDYSDPSAGRDIEEIILDPKIDATSKYDEICIRIGQQRFRREVLQYYDNQCAVTGSRVLIRASHIKPWRASTDEEKMDLHNGLALSPSYDAAFDLGLISFSPEGKIIVQPSFSGDAERIGISMNAHLRKLTEHHVSYLGWHRDNLYRKKYSEQFHSTNGLQASRSSRG
jgi:hypothetical protein